KQYWDYVQKGFAEAIADDKYVSDLAVHFSMKLGKEIALDEMRGYLKTTSENLQQPSEAKNTFLEKLLWQTDCIKNILLEKPWQIWRAASGSEFVTSDNPLITFIRLANDLLHPGYGFRTPGVVVAFPLAPSVCLAMGPNGPESVTFDQEHVMKINEVIAR